MAKKEKGFFGLSIDKREVDRLFADLPKVTKVATARTLDIVARKVNKNLKAEIAQTYNVPKKAMVQGDLINIQRANAKKNIGRAVIFIKKKGRTLMEYGAKQIGGAGGGLSVQIKKTQKFIKGGFTAPLRKGGPQDQLAFAKGKGKHSGLVTRRTKKGTPYKAHKREILWGPRISDLYTNDRADKIILKTIDDEFQGELNKQFDLQFEKKGRR